MKTIRVRVVCPFWHYPEVSIEPEHLQDAIERIAHDETLPPKCSIHIKPDFLYEGLAMETPTIVLPVDERLRTFLSFQPNMGAAFINKIAEWTRSQNDTPPQQEEEE